MVILIANVTVERRIGDVRHGSAWMMTGLNPSPQTGFGRAGRDHFPLFLLTLPGRSVDRCSWTPRRLLIVYANARGGDVRIAFAAAAWRVGGPDLAAHDIVPVGLCGALAAPAWLLITRSSCNGRKLDSAIAVDTAGYNVPGVVRRSPDTRSQGSASPSGFGVAASAICAACGLDLVAGHREGPKETLPAERLISA